MSTISIIIPSLSDSEYIPLLSSIKNIDYPKNKIEIILSIGKWPSLQRNYTARIAEGDVLYFFNKDVQITSDIFKKVVTIIDSDKNIAGVGGPDLTPIDNNYIQHLLGYAMASYFAHGRMRARYSQIERERFSNEKELLLSNLAIKKDIYLKVNGFNEKLYPNEENELINRISKIGYKFIYSPDLKVYRDRRKTLFEFIRQFYKYGQGRMNQIFIEGIFKNLYFFIPLVFLAYLFSLPFLRYSRISFIPLFIYISCGIIDAIYISFRNRKNLILQLPFIYITMHISYATGMLNKILSKFIGKKEGTFTDQIQIKYIKRFEDI